MGYVFDSSALLNIIRLMGFNSLSILRGGYILTLTIYEIGNALWKEAARLNTISVDEAIKILEIVTSIIYKALNIVDPQNSKLVLKLAHELSITYYDSSYIVAAFELNIGLVTDDKNLKSV
ncbi:type II toxin-antitoxin system VapC family toxin [Ignisphaera sp. 4213-co]|uniref:Type II toxin-antitoxin system VapC family toxin n=1 Tax=Ignisphaera cupida TaxID=3050454 RepID=A0ABD4Z3L7_9CREN|nr:type II toxin-antitoxin system VapC family toxin [Ignisphaera sp. 4213-co]MDK6027911.1 type II toxin-antitoxin system VapC family toxin [Ignisphaera sp. 4213-co]